MTDRMNAMWNCKNPYLGDFTRVLCVSSAGLLRSPTLAYVLSTDFGVNTRAAGIHDYALIQVDDVLLEWAHEIFCVEKYIAEHIATLWPSQRNKIRYLTLPDIYEYRHPELVELIKEQLSHDLPKLP